MMAHRHAAPSEQLVRDIISGLTVSMLALPQSLAFASVAGVDSSIAVISAVIAPIIYAPLATSHCLIVGPTSILSIVIAASPQSALLSTLIAGLIMCAVGIFNLARYYHNLVSEPVLDGFTVGAAFTIASTQIAAICGIKSTQANSLVDAIGALIGSLGSVNYAALSLGLAVFAVLIVFKGLKTKFTELKKWSGVFSLGVFSAAILSYALLNLKAGNVPVVGKLAVQFSTPAFPTTNGASWLKIISISLLIFVIGSMEGLALAIIFEKKIEKDFPIESSSETYSNALSCAQNLKMKFETLWIMYINRKMVLSKEVFAIGLANFLSPFFGGYASTGSLSRTAVNYECGARSSISNIVCGVSVLILVVSLGTYFQFLAKSVLAAIVLTSVSGLIQFRKAKNYFKTEKANFVIWFGTFSLVIVYGLEIGLGTGILLNLCKMLYEKINYKGSKSDPNFDQIEMNMAS
jgi:SulP family sulfate permease